MTAYVKGYMAGFGFGAVYYGACAIAAIYEVTALVHIGMFAFLSGTSINELAFALCAGAVGNNKAALVHTVLAVLSIGGAMYELSLSGIIGVTGPKGTVEVDIKGKANKGSTSPNNKDIYRAVSPEEFDDISNMGGFRGRPDGKSFEAKEFGNNLDETLDFANQPINSDKAAIVKVTIPEEAYNQLNHMNLDRSIFKSGTPVVEPEMLDFFNNSIISIEHVY